MKNKVAELIKKVDARTPNSGLDEEEIKKGIEEKKYSKHYKRDKTWRVAKAIYRWVAKNISYDEESVLHKKDSEGWPLPLRKPQDALFVYSQNTGVCEGYSRLLSLMMRMAGIPCAYLVSILNEEYGCPHAYNAIYLPSETERIGGWVLVDSTWGRQPGPYFSKKIKEYFNAFYNTKLSVEEDNKLMFDKMGHKIYLQRRREALKYSLGGSDENPSIILEGNTDDPINDLQIPQELLKYHFPFEIGKGIKSITLNRSEELRVGTSGNFINIFKTKPSFAVVKYEIAEDYIWLIGNANAPVKDLKIPQFLRDLNKKFYIYAGIQSIILQGDEELEFAPDSQVQLIETENSTKYIFSRGSLYEKTDGEKRGRFIRKLRQRRTNESCQIS